MSLYAFSVPTYQQILGGMLNVMDKAIAHVAAKKYDPASVLADRLFPDMFDFTKQVQSFTDHAARSSLLLGVVSDSFKSILPEVSTRTAMRLSSPETHSRTQVGPANIHRIPPKAAARSVGKSHR